MLVNVKLLIKSPDRHVLAATLETVYTGRGSRESLDDMRTAMIDCCAVNNAALTEAEKLHPGMKTLRAYCCSHTLSNSGCAFVGPELKEFTKYFRQMVMHQGSQARLVFKDAFEERPLHAGGVRWFVGWEQISQLNELGVEKFVDTVAKVR